MFRRQLKLYNNVVKCIFGLKQAEGRGGLRLEREELKRSLLKLGGKKKEKKGNI